MPPITTRLGLTRPTHESARTANARADLSIPRAIRARDIAHLSFASAVHAVPHTPSLSPPRRAFTALHCPPSRAHPRSDQSLLAPAYNPGVPSASPCHPLTPPFCRRSPTRARRPFITSLAYHFVSPSPAPTDRITTTTTSITTAIPTVCTTSGRTITGRTYRPLPLPTVHHCHHHRRCPPPPPPPPPPTPSSSSPYSPRNIHAQRGTSRGITRENGRALRCRF